MPIYEYRCEACQELNSVMQKLSDPAPASCPACGSGPMTKQMSRTSFILKGGGWYVTDFRDGGKKKDDKKADDKAGANDGGAADKSEAKSSDTDSKADSKMAPKSEPTSKATPDA